MKQSTAIALLFFTAVFLVLANTYYADLVFMYPYGFHDWAQADRLALAVKFYDNGMNFFKPTTYNLESIGGITGVEFPIQSYLAAALGHIFGRNNISICFRLLNLSISFLGLAFLFLICYKATRDIICSLITPIFFLCSPIFIFYSCNYLPDTAAVSICFIAFYFFTAYINDEKFSTLFKAIVFLTLATLIKTSVGTFLLGVMIVALIDRFQTKRYDVSVGKILILFALSMMIVGGYYLYNRYLNEHYSSEIFLAQASPFKEGDFDEYINERLKNFWIKEYFVLPQYLFLTAVIAAGIPFLLKSKPGRLSLATIVVFLLGVILMALLFGHQFLLHDYYVISIYFPLLAYAMVVSVTSVRQQIVDRIAIRSVRSFAVASLLILFVFADYHTYRRVHLTDESAYPGWRSSMRTNWMENGAKELDNLHISRKEKIVVMGEMAPNLAFVYFDRSGYMLDKNFVDDIEQFLKNRKLRIAVSETVLIDEMQKKHPDTLHNFDIVKKDALSVLILKS